LQIHLKLVLLLAAYSDSVVMNFFDVGSNPTICRVKFKIAVPVSERFRQMYALEGMYTDGAEILDQVTGLYVYIIRTDQTCAKHK
jgi:hypothetical protein